MKLSQLNITEDIKLLTEGNQEIDRLLSEGVITEGFAEIAKKAMAKGGEVLKQLHARGTVGSYELLKKLNSPVGRIAAVFAVGALGNLAMGAEDFVSNLSHMDGFDGAVDALQDMDPNGDVFDNQSMDMLDNVNDGGGDIGGLEHHDGLERGGDVGGLENSELAEIKAEVAELKAEQSKLVNVLKTVAMGDKSNVAIESRLEQALDNILDSESNADVVDNFTESAKYLKSHFKQGEVLDSALKFLKKAATIKIKILDQ